LDVLKKIVIVLIKIVLAFIGLVIAYILIALITTLIPVNSEFKNQESGISIWISSNGVHTNIIVPIRNGTNDWSEFLKTEKYCNYFVFGWGDKEFYMNTPEWSDLKFTTTFNALFIPTESVMQVYCVGNPPPLSKNTKKVHLTNQQYDRIVSYIFNSFVKDSLDKPIEIIPEKGAGSIYKYFKAKGKYSLFFTCNNWTSRGLKRAGVKNSLWAPFDKSVLFYLK
jgi:uncharacterized protein (TIGR02117 family)